MKRREKILWEGCKEVVKQDCEARRASPRPPSNRTLICNKKKFRALPAKYRASEKSAAREYFSLKSSHVRLRSHGKKCPHTGGLFAANDPRRTDRSWGLAEGEELKTNILHAERRFLECSSERTGSNAYCCCDQK
jgi:hypothetical protein